MSKLFIHIGTQKTGSTSIQDFMVRNSVELKKVGIVYPDPKTSSYGFERQNHGHLGFSLSRYWFKTEKKYDAREAWGGLLEDFEKLESKEDMVVSTEALSTPQAVKGLKRIADLVKGVDTKVIVYLKRPDLLVESLYIERLKGGEGRPIDWAVKQGDYLKCAGYEEILDAWASVVGVENVIVRPFTKSKFQNGGLIDDFLERIGCLNNGKFSALSGGSNQGMNPCLYSIFRHLNGLNEEKPIPGLLKKKLWMIDCLNANSNSSGMTSDSVEGKGKVLSPSQRMSILESFEEETRRVVEKYCPEFSAADFYEEFSNDDLVYYYSEPVNSDSIALLVEGLLRRGGDSSV